MGGVSAIAVAALLLPGVAAAAPSRPVATQLTPRHALLTFHGDSLVSLTRSLGRVHAPAALPHLQLGSRFHSNLQTPNLDISDATALGFQFPTGSCGVQSQVVSTSFADSSDTQTGNPFLSFHGTTAVYGPGGMTSGLIEAGQFAFGSGAGVAIYLGSLFATDAQATTFVNNTVTYLTGKGLKDQPSSDGTLHAFQVPLVETDGNVVFLTYVITANANVVSEFAFISTLADTAANSTELGTAIGSIGGVALQAANGQPSSVGPTSACPKVTIQGGVLEHSVKVKSKKKTKTTLKATKTLKYGEKGVFAAQAQIQNASDAAPAASITFFLEGKNGPTPLKSGPMQVVNSQNGTVLFAAASSFKRKANTKITAVIEVTDGAGSDEGSLTFTVKKK